MAKYKYIGPVEAYIEGRLTQPGQYVDIPEGQAVQTADVCPDEPLFEAQRATKKATTAKDEE